MPESGAVRLAEVLGAVSLAVDLGLGQPMGHVARSCLLAQRLGAAAGIAADEAAELYYVTLMGWVGCIADSHQAAAWFGNDIDYRAGVYDLDMRPLPFLGYLLGRVAPDEPAPRRVGRAAALLATGARGVQESLRTHCLVTEQVARRLALPDRVCRAAGQVFARWDGQGLPTHLSRSDIAVTIRLWHIADVAEVHHARGGVPAAVATVRSRRGTQFDPELVDLFTEHAEEFFHGADARQDTTWDDVVAAEPAVARTLSDDELDIALAAIADWIDLKSPYFTGHSQAVADLAAGAATMLRLPDADVRLTRRAGLVHDIGRAGVPNTLWDKGSSLSTAEVERIRLHSYYTERVLTQPAALAEIGQVAGSAHERLDGSGYHRGRTATDLSLPCRILAAADSFHTSRERRPHRPAMTAGEAAGRLRRQAAAGRLDPDAVDAVLAVAGQRSARGPVGHAGPAGLTRREIQVLRELAAGKTNRQIARALGISTKTVGNHVEHIYAKSGVSSRASATLFAMEHGLT